MHLAPILLTFPVALFISSCAATSDLSDPSLAPNTQSYTDPASGVVFPKSIASLERVSLTPNHSGVSAIRAHYLSTDKLPPPMEDQVGLMRRHMEFFLNADIVVGPATLTPDQVVAAKLAEANLQPNFVHDTYPTTKSFGSETAICAQCTFDRPVWQDRATCRVLVIPHGNYIVSISFIVASTQAGAWESVMEDFARQFFTQSTKPS